MALTTPASSDGIDRKRVERWLADNVASLAPPFRFTLIAGGRSNLTFRGEDGRGTAFVLRRPPLGEVLQSAHDMGREHRVLSALQSTDVPVPRPLGYCEDAAVNGAPFYVMQHLDGVVVREPADVPDGFGVAQREPLTWSLVDTLAQIHAQDADAVGLGRLGRREDYLGRQLLRWQRQYDQVRSRELPALEEVHRRLLDAKPPQQRDAIVHGDYRIDNVIFGRQPVVIGVLDWELCTLGDPLADLGGLLVQWVHPDEDGSFMLGRTPMQLPGFPTREQIAARYAAATSLDVSGIDYYMAFAYWRLACIGEGVYARFRDGAMGDQDDGGIVRRLGEQVVMLAELALERIG